VRDGPDVLGLWLRDPDERGLVAIGRQVPVDAVVGGVEPPADEPPPKRRIARVQRRMPVGIPREQIGILLEAFGKAFLTESLKNAGIGRVCLRDELGRRVVVLLFTPVHRDLRLGGLRLWTYRHCSTSLSKTTPTGSCTARASTSPATPVGHERVTLKR